MYKCLFFFSFFLKIYFTITSGVAPEQIVSGAKDPRRLRGQCPHQGAEPLGGVRGRLQNKKSDGHPFSRHFLKAHRFQKAITCLSIATVIDFCGKKCVAICCQIPTVC